MAVSFSSNWECDVCKTRVSVSNNNLAPNGWTDFAWEPTEVPPIYDREYSNEKTLCNDCSRAVFATLVYNGDPPIGYFDDGNAL